MSTRCFFFLLFTLSFCGKTAVAQWELTYAQGLIGVQDMQAAWTIEHEDGSSTSGRDDLIYLGGLAQFSGNEGLLQYGFEAGGLFTFQNDLNYFFITDGGIQLEVVAANNFWALDLFTGGYLSINPSPNLRLYAAAGPALVIGSLYVNEDELQVNPLENEGANFTIDMGGRQNTTDISLYGRVGIDFIPVQDLVIGLSARTLSSELEFENNGRISLNGTQYFLTFTRKY